MRQSCHPVLVVVVVTLCGLVTATCTTDPVARKQAYYASGNQYFSQQKFAEARIEYRSPVPPADKLQTIAASASAPLNDMVDVLNANIDKLNGRLFTFLDYAIVARRA